MAGGRPVDYETGDNGGVCFGGGEYMRWPGYEFVLCDQ